MIEHGIVCDDTLARILSFLDFQSAVVTSRMTSKRIRQRCAVINRNTITSTSTCSPCIYSNAICGTNAANHLDESEYNLYCFQKLWREFYQRQLFPPIDYYKHQDEELIDDDGGNKRRSRVRVDYIELCKHKRQLFNRFTQMGQRTNAKSSSFSIPNRCFRYLPIQPSTEDGGDGVGVGDSHAVDFACASYMLTSLSTGGEYVFLDPFDGSLTVHSNIMAHVSPKGQWFQSRVDHDRNLNDSVDVDDDVDVDVDVTGNNVNSQNTPTSISEILFGVQDYFQLDLHEYFEQHNNKSSIQGQGRSRHHPMQLSEEHEVVVDWIGIDTHTIVDPKGNMVGNMICAARELSVDVNGHGVDEGRTPMRSEITSCTEILAWKKCSLDGKYGDQKYSCRLEGSPYYMEICPLKEVVYACFSPGRSDSYRSEGHANANTRNWNENVSQRHEEHADDDVSLDDRGLPIHHSYQIYVFPLVEIKNSHKQSFGAEGQARQYFPKLRETMSFHNPVRSFVSEPTGDNLIVGCDNGIIEIWNVADVVPSRRHVIDITARLKHMMKSAQNIATQSNVIDLDGCEEMQIEIGQQDSSSSAMITVTSEEESGSPTGCTTTRTSIFEDHENDMYNNIMSFTDTRMAYASALDHLNESMQMEMERSETLSAATTIDMALEQDESSNISLLSQCKSNRAVNQILVPKHLSISKAGFVTLQHHKTEGTTLMLWQYRKLSFDIVSMVNLPLSTQRKPQVAYDGKRLVVFGQDHIGLIILIYKIYR